MNKMQVKARQRALVEVYEATRNGNPKDTVAKLEKKIGVEEARLAVAELVRSVGDWDARVWDYVREWADTVEGAASREEMSAGHIYQPSEVHPVHINQLGLEYEKEARSA